MKKKPASDAASEGDESSVARFTVHLFGQDLERLRELRGYLRKLGVDEANRSLLVKLALRGVELGPGLKVHLDAIQSEDGRRTRHAQPKRKAR
jgi:hypothetical protein